MEALERRSTLAVKLEMSALTGTVSSTGTAVTGVGTAFDTELQIGDVIGNDISGYRRVISITDATHLVVDSAFNPELSSGSISKSAYAVDPTIALGDVIEHVDFTLEPDRAEIARDVKRNTFSELETIMGEETVSGDITVELHGSGTPGTAPEADPLYHCAMGEKRASSASETITGSSTTSIKLGSADGVNHRIGEAIMLDPTVAGSGAYEVSFITNIVGDVLTVYPAFSLAPPTGRAIGAGVHYNLSKNELKSLWTQFWRGDITLEQYKGCKVNNLSMDFTSGAIINPKFTIQAKETADPTAANYALGTPAYDSGVVHLARYMVVRVNDTLYAVDKIAFTVANELFAIKAVTSAGTQKMVRVKRTVTGSFSLLYESKDIEAAFRAGTKVSLMIVSSSGESKLVLGNTFAAKLPQIKYTKATKGKDSGIFKYDVPFKAVVVAAAGEDEVSSLSFL